MRTENLSGFGQPGLLINSGRVSYVEWLETEQASMDLRSKQGECYYTCHGSQHRDQK